jgi:hypothetical protein
MLRSLGLPEAFVLSIAFMIVILGAVPFFRISKRLGYSRWWGLLNLCPFGTVVWAYYVAFAHWPHELPSR